MENNTRTKDDSKYPIKKCHRLDGKYFVVLDESIVQRLQYSEVDDSELYFQQELTKDGCITLRQFRLQNQNDEKNENSL